LNQILDVATRWNNTYMMLSTAIGFKEVFPRYSNIESAFQWVVSAEEWEKVENVNQFLAIFNEVTNIVLDLITLLQICFYRRY
jgi:hypothetical protein